MLFNGSVPLAPHNQFHRAVVTWNVQSSCSVPRTVFCASEISRNRSLTSALKMSANQPLLTIWGDHRNTIRHSPRLQVVIPSFLGRKPSKQNYPVSEATNAGIKLSPWQQILMPHMHTPLIYQKACRYTLANASEIKSWQFSLILLTTLSTAYVH